MTSRLVALGSLLVVASTARAEVLRVSADPPLSGERFADALRSYVDGAEVTLASPAGGAEPTPGEVAVHLLSAEGREAEVQMVDGEETILARLPGAQRTEDLYRAAALKVQALLQRRAPTSGGTRPAGALAERLAPPQAEADRLWLDAGFALLLPSNGLAREGLRLATALLLGRRFRLGLGTYLEAPQTTNPQGIKVSAWEIPLSLSLGFAWHQGRWQGWLDAVGQAALRRISAEAAGVVSSSDTALSPRAGGALGLGVGLGAGWRVEARVALLAALADTRYRVDGQVVWPAARALVLLELGLAYGVR
jgi:hypothetical protein